MKGRSLLLGALLIGACVPLLYEPAWAQDEHAGHSAGEQLGSVHFPISCSQDAQRQFDRAVALLHSFFYPETVKAFSAIAQAEPACGAFPQRAAMPRLNPLRRTRCTCPRPFFDAGHVAG